jgi:hypothetical protein
MGGLLFEFFIFFALLRRDGRGRFVHDDRMNGGRCIFLHEQGDGGRIQCLLGYIEYGGGITWW